MVGETAVISLCCSGISNYSSACAGFHIKYVAFSFRQNALHLDQNFAKVGLEVVFLFTRERSCSKKSCLEFEDQFS